jgi:hypothetical protein
LPRFSFVVICTCFVAIYPIYCNNMHEHCNMAMILRQPISVARVSHFVAI